MRRIIRYYTVNTASLYIVTQIANGLVFEKGPVSLLLAGAGLTVASLLVRPLINILLLPINLVTFGLFKWVSSAIALYIVTLVVPGFKIINFYFAGLSTKWVDLPKLSFTGIIAIIAFSFLLSLTTSLVHWLVK
jgi:putative membrane protein